MLSSRCEQNALVGIFTHSESHFLPSYFLEGLFAGWAWMNCCFVWGGRGDEDSRCLLAHNMCLSVGKIEDRNFLLYFNMKYIWKQKLSSKQKITD